MSYHLVNLIQNLGHPRLLVLGDLILDRYVWGHAERVSQEAPVILLREERQEERPGGAANVVNLLRGLEAEVLAAGVIGDDADGFLLRRQLEEAGADVSAVLTDASRPTTVKQRFLGGAEHRHPHQMLRVDREVRTPISARSEEWLMEAVTARLEDCAAVLISDYAKGVCTPRLLQTVIQQGREKQKPVIIDPSSSARYGPYRQATAMTPNRLETARATGWPVETVEQAFTAGRRLCSELELDYCFVTLDREGIALIRSDGTAELFPTRQRDVYDITGAGDMVLATIGVGAAAGVSPPDLARLANIAGGLEVEHVGVVRITRKQMVDDVLRGHRGFSEKIVPLADLQRHVAARKELGQRIVFTNGCFDLLHPGHVQFLQEAATHGECLIVAVNTDASIRRLKGAERPLIPQEDRATMLAALECVDYVTLFDQQTPLHLLDVLRPHLLVKGGTTPQVVGQELVEQYGGQVLRLNSYDGYSTTDLIGRIRKTASPSSSPRAA